MTKQRIYWPVFVLCFIIGCTKEDPILPLLVDGLSKKPIFLAPSGKLKLKPNQRVTWKVAGGTVVQSDNDSVAYTAPTTAGIYSLVIKSERNTQDSLAMTVVVSSRATVFQNLQQGGYGLLFRHAAADVGIDQTTSKDTAWFKSCDAALARQLNEQGKKDAANIGKMLKITQIPVARLFTSEFCRCFTTANLMNLGIATQQNRGLTYAVRDETNRYNNTIKLANSQPIDDKNTVIIGHVALLGNDPNITTINSLAWGDAVVFKLLANQTPQYITTLRVTDFTELVK